jgi:hypothetical protein
MAHRREKGQVLIMAAFSMVIVLGFTALAIDTGYHLRNVRDAQNDVDAAMLASVQELGNGISAGLSNAEAEANALAKAQEWATYNGAAGQLDCCTFSDFNGDGLTDTVEGTVSRSSEAYFARVVGIDSFSLERGAAARMVNAAGGSIMPWALCGDKDQPLLWGVQEGEEYVVKVGAGQSKGQSAEEGLACGPQTGNFQILNVGGPDDDGDCKQGAVGYRYAIENGGSCYAYTADDEVLVDTKPGNLGLNTKDAIEQYLADRGETGNYKFCDDYENNGGDLVCQARHVLVAIIDHDLPQGKKPVAILDLAPVYITWWTRTPPWGESEVRAILKTNAYIPGWTLLGAGDDSAFSALRPTLVK